MTTAKERLSWLVDELRLSTEDYWMLQCIVAGIDNKHERSRLRPLLLEIIEREALDGT